MFWNLVTITGILGVVAILGGILLHTLARLRSAGTFDVGQPEKNKQAEVYLACWATLRDATAKQPEAAETLEKLRGMVANVIMPIYRGPKE